MTFPANVLTIALQKQILKLVDAGATYEQIREALHVNSTVIARVKRRRQVYRDGLVDTEFEGQPMNSEGGTYECVECDMLCKIYAVLDLRRNRIIYTGPSIGNTAARLEPGCVYGWGEDVTSAREDVRRRAREFNRDVKR